MSSLSPVGICRRALQRVGVTKTIASLTDPQCVEERLCAACYDDIRKGLLRNHTWNFAKKRVQLAAELTDPVFEFDKKFALPADFIRLVQIGEHQIDRIDIEYSIENGFILVGRNLSEDPTTLDIVYVADEQDVTKWDSLFIEMVRLKVAHTIAYPLTKKNTLVQAIAEEIKDIMPKSKSADGQDSPLTRIEASRIIANRRGRCGISNKYQGYYFRSGYC